MRRLGIVIGIILLWTPGSISSVWAEEVQVSANGVASANEVTVVSQPSTSVVQNQQLVVVNSIQTEATTGDNNASSNTGATTIQTGNATAVTQVATTGNVSTLQTGCCQNLTTVGVNSNGSNSQNTISNFDQITTNIAVLNRATITNTLHTTASTGSNKANLNTGNVQIQTGNVTVRGEIANTFNQSRTRLPSSSSHTAVAIRENGSASNSLATKAEQAQTTISEANTAHLTNAIATEGLSGANIASLNTGTVSIKTGEVRVETIVRNVSSNTTSTASVCCLFTTPQPGNMTPTSAPPPQALPWTHDSRDVVPGGVSTGSSGGTSGRNVLVLGMHSTSVAVASTTPWMFMAILANVTMFQLGLYLRLRSGRAPAVV